MFQSSVTEEVESLLPVQRDRLRHQAHRYYRKPLVTDELVPVSSHDEAVVNG
ncbi:hypothetical protein [Nocardia colli]|uniref:hypothetical protein n=1 Tax=Nocardia colli TaxID=2545717 RepID=UPI0035D8A2E2